MMEEYGFAAENRETERTQRLTGEDYRTRVTC